MAVSTTQSIWRSGGGDQTRTAYCGSGVMVAEWYVGNVATQTGNVRYKARERYSFGVSDPLGVYGSPGA